MSCNIECELIKQIKRSQGFDIHVDESTDITGLSVLLAFVRYIHNEQVGEAVLTCKHLPTHTTGEDMFNLIDLYMALKGLIWKQHVDICTDGT
jgi:hypothetical protein